MMLSTCLLAVIVYCEILTPASTLSCEIGSLPLKLDWPVKTRTKLFIDANKIQPREALPITYFYDPSNNVTSIYHDDGQGKIFIVKNNTLLAVINETGCEVKNRTTTGQKDVTPLLIDFPIDNSTSSIVTLDDLFSVMKALKYTNVTSAGPDLAWTGSKLSLLTSCYNISKDVFVVYSVTVSGDFQLPISVEISSFKGTWSKSTLSQTVNFRFSNLSAGLTEDDDEMLLPPKGFDCGDFTGPSKNISVKFPDSFFVRTEYVNVSSGAVDYNRIFVNSKKHIVSYNFNSTLLDQVVTSRSPAGDLKHDCKIVHDLNSGLQYAVNDKEQTCLGVAAVPSVSGDVRLTGNGSFAMRTPFDILYLQSENITFSFAGKRSLNDIKADVYVTTTNDAQGKKAIFELWMSDKYSTFGQSLPVALLVYRNVGNRIVLSSKQHFYDYTTSEAVPDVMSCLELNQNGSYLLVELYTDKDDAKVNYDALAGKLREELSERANVSLLRINNFYFQPVNKTMLYAFFLLANRSSVAGLKTDYFTPELDLEHAHKALNQSLINNTLELDVSGIKLKSTKNALNFVPPFFVAGNDSGAGTVVYKSSKGAMAALAIFMLIIGLAGGFGLAFFLYKRNRGIQYQIYE